MSKSLALAVSGLALCLGLFVGVILMSSEITEQKEEISFLLAKIRSSEIRIVALRNQIKDRDEEILKLKGDIKFLEETLK